ncbi:MAG: cytochrome c peroxidase, partial [Saprospiraceae bacterium]
MKNLWVLILIVIAISIFACSKDPKIDLDEQLMLIPEGFPSINFPDGNEFTKERWLLGKKLFYDKRLSKSKSISCGSCHKPELAFSDNVALSDGDNFEKGTSNAPSLVNVAYHPYYTRAGGIPTLEMQILVPIQEHNEFNHNIVDIAMELDADSEYHRNALESYNRDFDPYVLTRALSNFERSLISGNSRFDMYYYQGKKNAISAGEIRGLNLFMSTKTNCSQCHSGFNFSNYTFQNNGLYES